MTSKRSSKSAAAAIISHLLQGNDSGNANITLKVQMMKEFKILLKS